MALLGLRTIRVRLTLWYLAILTAILLLFSAAVYLTIRSALWEQLDDSIENRGFLVHELVVVGADGRPRLDLALNPELDDVFVRLFDAKGSVVFDGSAVFDGVPQDSPAIKDALGGRTTRDTVDAGSGEVRVHTTPLAREGEVIGSLQVGQATDDLHETLDRLLLILAVAIPTAVLLSAGGGWWLSSRALGPIDRVTRAAAEISSGADLSRRLNMGRTDDEVGRLGATFDDMLGRLQSAFERQRQFTSDASHELRTPLTALRGQVDVALQQARTPEEYQRVLAEVSAQVDRMTRLSVMLLSLARSDSGRVRLARERVDAEQVVRMAAEQITPAALAKGLDVVVEEGGAATLEGDETLLLQMLMNLAENAVKYTDAGRVGFGWRSEDAAVELIVSDTGPGIPDEYRERVFERFFRTEASRTEAAGGFGLGLPIARSIAEMHGGTIAVQRGSRGGSAFVVRLPRPDAARLRTQA